MAQDGTTAGGSSYTIDNVTFPVGRTKLQSIFDAIRSSNIGNTAPDLVAGQFWIDNNTPSTTVWTLYLYDGTDNISFATIDTINNTVNFIDSTFDLINDTTPQLGGNLDLNSNDITGTGNINITGTIESSGNITGTLATASQPNITQTGTLSSLNVDASAGTGVIGITLDNGTVTTSKDSSSFRSQLSMYNTTGQVAKFDTASDDLFLQFADDLVFRSITGTEYMRIDSSGNVGIGSSAPTQKLFSAVDSTLPIPTSASMGSSTSGVANGIGIHNTNNSAQYSGLTLETKTTNASRWLIANEWKSNFNGDLVFRSRIDGSSSSEILRLKSDGKVGIGTASPSSLLHIFSSAPKLIIQDGGTHGTNSAPRLEFKDGSSIQGFVDFADDGTMRIDQVKANPLTFLTNNVERMRISSAGLVGIGTSSPRAKLDLGAGSGDSSTISTTASDYQLILEAPQGTGDYGRNIGWCVGTGTVNASINAVDTGSSDKTGLAFVTGDSSGVAEAVRISHDGKVGIGTSSPTRTLHVNASGGANVEISRTGLGGLYFESDGTNGITRSTSATGSLIFQTNGNNERMRINSSGNVGIGTSSPDAMLHIHDDGASTSTHSYTKLHLENDDHLALQFSGSTVGEQWIWFADDTTATPVGGITYYHGGPYMGFRVEGAERMRIDSSGNLLVGTTSSNVYNTTGDEGITIKGSTNNIQVQRSNGTPFYLNRTDSDGTIADFRKDGTVVGSIGANSSSLYIAGTSKGFRFTASQLKPCNTSGANDDGNYDLGSSSTRFKDLYLGGGLYVGGTGSANQLEDYEEGDWTPGYTASSGTPVYSTRAGSYTKVGRKVTVTGAINGARGSLSGDVTISGLPFSCASATKFSNSVSLMGEDWNSTFSFKGRVQNNNNVIQLYKEATNTAGFVGVNQGDMKTGASQDNFVQFTVTYTTA